MEQATLSDTQVPCPREQLATLLGISALYIGFGMTMVLIQGGFPAIMRAQGISLGTAGGSLASAVITASACVDCADANAGGIDGSYGGAAGRRCHGILFAMGLFVAFTMATMHIALDGLAVERIHSTWRPRAAACKLGALSTGAMIGGGAFVALFHTYGWKAIFLCYAVSLCWYYRCCC